MEILRGMHYKIMTLIFQKAHDLLIIATIVNIAWRDMLRVLVLLPTIKRFRTCYHTVHVRVNDMVVVGVVVGINVCSPW